MTPGAIIDRFMLGTARQTIVPEGTLAAGIAEADPDASLKLLALAAQAMRFAPPVVPNSFDPVATQIDARRVLSDAARKMLMRLVTGKAGSPDDCAARAAAWAMAGLHLRPHPFDLPRMAPFVRRFAEDLGQTAITWSSRGEAQDSAAHYFEADQVDAQSWTLATPARKAGFIAAMRSHDAAGARDLVAAQLPLEKADVRVRLVAALSTGLNVADQPLLESLATDRAPKVKELATRLLARLPGTAAGQAMVADIVGRITVSKSGLFRKRTTLRLTLPANVSKHNPSAWLADTFSSVGLTVLAQGLGLTVADAIEAAADDHALQLGFIFAACTDREFGLLEQLCGQYYAEAWQIFLQIGLEPFGLVTPGERARWAAAVLTRKALMATPGVWQLDMLHQQMEGPLPADTAQMLASACANGAASPDWALPMVALTPLPILPSLRESLKALPREHIARALLLADFLIEISSQTKGDMQS